jgi:predicted type IV restriction endonuclease
MAFEEDVLRHAEQVKARLPHIHGEEATKQALVIPFFQILGYDVYDPRELQPEYIADFAEKKARGQMEKIDYAVRINGEPAIFIECKAADATISDHDAQLARYFNATPSVRVAVLTNGVQYRVFTDLQQQNIMDDKPWLEFDIRSAKPAEIEAIKKFRKSDFVADQIVGLAEEMVYYNVLVSFVSAQLRDPGENFVRFVASEIPAVGRVTAKVVERLTPILKKAMQASIVDHVARSFTQPHEPPPPPPAVEIVPPLPVVTIEARDGIVTTADELEAWNIIFKIVREARPDAVVQYRDSKSYFTIIQKNIRKWFIRLGVERAPLWIAFRHLRADEAKRLLPGIEAVDGGGYGDSKVNVKSVQEIAKLRPLILASYDAELARVGDADQSGEFEVPTAH